MKRSIFVGRYLGIGVFLHYSWFLIFLLLAWALSTGFFPQQFPGQSGMEYWGIGIFSSLLLFVSVLLHELSHSVIARRNGMKVDRITLFFFGGMASAHEQHMNPKNEFQMAIAGPAMSLFLSGIALIVYNVTSFFYVAAVASYLYRINLILAIFNLVPGFPLDGGRVLRAIVWYWTGDFRRATRIATTGGKVVAYVLIFLGFVNVFAGSFSGLWLVLIGFFLLVLARMSYEQLVIKEALKGLKVADFTDGRYPRISPGTSLRDAVSKHFLKKDSSFFLVRSRGRLVGAISIDDVQRIPKKRWRGLNVEDVMKPAKSLAKSKMTAPAYSALVKMLKKGQDFLPVLDRKGKKGKDIVGIMRRDTVLRYVKLQTTKERLKKAGFDVEE